ncbi:hypothetical protein GCM10010123_32130 [Pilimelia anulata]|uniref:Uncharacterized protein n=1 Tax=Pilimelia anulata TaxID=53371 RepID=A0A8J3FA73_9ACTN|nr:hypothetical protein GCM10010123_32130 [Pilimelia anulata]
MADGTAAGGSVAGGAVAGGAAVAGSVAAGSARSAAAGAGAVGSGAAGAAADGSAAVGPVLAADRSLSRGELCVTHQTLTVRSGRGTPRSAPAGCASVRSTGYGECGLPPARVVEWQTRPP